MDRSAQNRLRDLFLQVQLHLPDEPGDTCLSSDEVKVLSNKICTLIFPGMAYRQLWNEAILSHLSRLLQLMPPRMYRDEVAEIHKQAQQAKKVNDLFFRVLSSDVSVEKVVEAVRALSFDNASLLPSLKASDFLGKIRKKNDTSSQKVAKFLKYLRDNVGIDLASQEAVMGCQESLKHREESGVNALLVRSDGNGAIVIPLQIIIKKNGNGKIHHGVLVDKGFSVALDRARQSLLERGFLSDTDEVFYSFELTGSEYRGPSICLAAAVGMYSAAIEIMADPYTAFTGDIKLDHQGWRIAGISGIHEKIKAAQRSGCRRVFIPRENLKEVESTQFSDLQIIAVDDLLEILFKLQTQTQPLPGNSLQIRKINQLQACCLKGGWALSEPKSIQHGLQFRIAPLHSLPQLVISIYNTGSHTPRKHNAPDYHQLLESLQTLEESTVSLRKVEQTLQIQDLSIRQAIRDALEELQPNQSQGELHCDYVFLFEQEQERLVVKQYGNGTLHIQGRGGELYKRVLDCVVPQYNLHYPNAQISVESLLGQEELAKPVNTIRSPSSSGDVSEIPVPHIGTDESGKGDYFGPMVVAGIFLDGKVKSKMESLGIRDSKRLSDKKCREIAVRIRELCNRQYAEVEISPERYNSLYNEFQKEGKNLNHLLAWGHARAIEDLLSRFSCNHAVADQFGDEHYILSRLMEKGRKLQLIQLPKGEQYLAVAAASILARDRFLARLERLSEEYDLILPKGASENVVGAAKQVIERRGEEELRKVAKLHHRTTQKVIEKA